MSAQATSHGSMIPKLIAKDWTFQRGPIAIFSAVGLGALYFLGTGGTGSFYLGSILLISVVIGLGVGMVLAYWPYRRVRNWTMWNRHCQAVAEEQTRRRSGMTGYAAGKMPDGG